MELTVCGPVRLSGTVRVSGAKNAALPLLAASVLCSRPFVVRRIPWVRDVATMLTLLGALGVRSTWVAEDAVRLDPGDLHSHIVPAELARTMRASFCLLGPLLARTGKAVLPMPGGCRIGPRPVDVHVRELARLGASFEIREGLLHAEARELRSTCLLLTTQRGPSVTGTANLLMAATGARGETVMTGTASEPEVKQLCSFLQACGVQIEETSPGVLRVISPGLPLEPPPSIEVIPDRIEAATWLCAAAATGGDITVQGVAVEHLSATAQLLAEAGATVEVHNDSLRISLTDRPQAFAAVARPYPGLPTDVQAQLCAVATQARGRSTVRDEVFPHRWHHIEQLTRLGAEIRLVGNQAIIDGAAPLQGTTLEAADLRGSAALVIAALAARGTSVIRHIEHLWRGYENLPAKLRQLGTDVQVTGDTFALPRAA